MNSVKVYLRVEADKDSDRTVFSGSVDKVGSDGKVTPDGGTERICDGTNGNENPLPGPTCTKALHVASHPADGTRPFKWHGTYYPSLDDFLISDFSQSKETFWSLWLNYKYASVGGGHLQIKEGDTILWALIPQEFTSEGVPLSIPLRLKGPREPEANKNFTVTVINGSDQSPVRYAQVTIMGGDTVITDKHGTAVVKLAAGTYKLKARRDGDIQSNEIEVTAA